MKTPYLSYKVADFVLDREFRKWVLKPDRESNLFWQEWLDANPDKTGTIAEAVKLIKQLSLEKHQLTDQEKLALLKDIDHSVSRFDQLEKPNRREEIIQLNAQTIVENRAANNSKVTWRKSKILKYAASVAILAAIFLFIKKTGSFEKGAQNTPQSIEEIVMENPWGKRTTVLLSDGTKVFLNSGSSITYLKPFRHDERIISLQGEAFFEVAHDPQRPFKVVTSDITTVALGTAFNILEAPRGQQVKISLVEGNVGVGFTRERINKDRHILSPGEEIIYSTANSTFSKGSFDEEKVTAWKDGIIYFKDADEATVINKLERWYGIEITVINSASSKWDLTAKFDNQPLINVLNSLAYTLDFEHNTNDNQVIIRF